MTVLHPYSFAFPVIYVKLYIVLTLKSNIFHLVMHLKISYVYCLLLNIFEFFIYLSVIGFYFYIIKVRNMI